MVSKSADKPEKAKIECLEKFIFTKTSIHDAKAPASRSHYRPSPGFLGLHPNYTDEIYYNAEIPP